MQALSVTVRFSTANHQEIGLNLQIPDEELDAGCKFIASSIYQD